MNDEKNNFVNIERKVQKFFQKTAGSLKADKDLWSKLEPKLDEKLKDVEPVGAKRRSGKWLTGPRLVIVSASLSVVFILIVVGSMWLTTNHSADIETSPNSDRTMIEHGLGMNSGAGVTVITPTWGMPQNAITQPIPLPQVTLAPTTTALASSSRGAISAPAASGVNGFNSTGSGSDVLDTSGRQVISQASISLEVNTVSTALSQVETIAQNLGGQVDSMSSNGEQDQQQATITIRVPQEQFLAALDKLQSLGTVQSQNVSSQDVTAQFIDLQARLKSSQIEEQSLQAVLDKAVTVSDIISIQDQLNQVRSTIESLQGQINYIQNRVDMATIDVTLNEPTQNVGQAPSASLSIKVSNVDSTLASVKQLITGTGGIIDSNTVSLNNGKENAYLSLRVYRANFDQVITAMGKEGKILQKTVQEDVTAQNGQSQQSNSPLDASISLSLTEASGFWTTTNIVVISVAGGVVILTLLIFLVLAGRAGLLGRRTS